MQEAGVHYLVLRERPLNQKETMTMMGTVKYYDGTQRDTAPLNASQGAF